MKVSTKIDAIIDIFEENDFMVHLLKEGGVLCADIETWTTEGVNMIHSLVPFTVEEFERTVDDFDVDTEIDRHRQDKRYRDDFSITGSLKDFEEYHTRLKELLKWFKSCEKTGEDK